jgi:hypothetical protein
MLAGEIQDRDFEAQMHAFLLLRYGGSLVTMTAALFGIFTADKKSRWVTGLAVAGVLAGTAFACWSAWEQDREHATEVKQTVASINTNTTPISACRPRCA